MPKYVHILCLFELWTQISKAFPDNFYLGMCENTYYLIWYACM